MIRNLKALTLTLVAVLAMSALAASAASATSDFTAGASSGTIKATQTTEQVFTTTAGTIKCSTSNQEGSYVASTITEIELSATFGGCKAFGFLTATVNMGGCKWKFQGKPEPRTFQFVYGCIKGEITIETTGCVIHIPAQQLTGHMMAVNVPSPTGTYTLEKIKYTETSGCPNVTLGTNPTTENGTFTGGSLLQAFNTSGAEVSLVAD